MAEGGRRADGLAERFPKAALVPAGPELAEAAAQVAAFVDAPARGLDLPLDIRGTAFQHRVWSALRNIEVGERISYAELAMRVGSPRGSRAVAQACANNRIAVTIPCHRVVRGDGQLAGYRWGIARKRALLDLEARVSMTGAETESLP